MLLFGDRVHQSMAIADGVIYSLEGKRATQRRRATSLAARGRFKWGSPPRRSRSNWLTAYQAGGGKVMWTRTASDEDKEESAEIGFLAAPAPCGNLLLAPVTDGGTIWLFGLDRATGKTVWKTYLCDEPQGGASPWAEPVVAVRGPRGLSHLRLRRGLCRRCGGGTIRWAVRYSATASRTTARGGCIGGSFNAPLDLNGWDDDVVIPYGRLLIVHVERQRQAAGARSPHGRARVGIAPHARRWAASPSYCLGVHGRGLFVAGKNVVRRYDIPSGRLERRTEIDDSFGRGCVTDDAVYLPVGDSILKLDLELKHALAQVGSP